MEFTLGVIAVLLIVAVGLLWDGVRLLTRIEAATKRWLDEEMCKDRLNRRIEYEMEQTRIEEQMKQKSNP